MRFILDCYLKAKKDKHSVSGYLGIINDLATFIAKRLDHDLQSEFIHTDIWTELQDNHLHEVFSIERDDRDDVFKKAFEKDTVDSLDGLLLLSGRTGFGGFNRLSVQNARREAE